MITRYHRPTTLGEAVALLENPDAFVLAGGTAINGDPSLARSDAVDIQSLDLSGIESGDDSVRIGSMTRLQDIVTSPLVPRLIAELAHREAPNTIRNAATIGGIIGTNDSESELLVGLLAFGASVRVAWATSDVDHSLDEILADPRLVDGAIMTSISIDAGGIASAHRTGRTPRDRPIVAVAGHKDEGGAIRFALTGVDSRVVVVPVADIANLDPPSDFRGSSEYRRRLASILAGRVLADLGGGGAE